jgi:hypothetical protein
MRFDNYISEDTKGFFESLDHLSEYDSEKLKNILEASWIKLRESLSHSDQVSLVNVINETFSTDYDNIYYIPTQLECIRKDWKSKIKEAPQAWSLCHESIGDSVILRYGLVWVGLVQEG